MKFKPLYFYGAVFLTVVIILIIVSQQTGTENTQPEEISTKQNLPDDDIHNPFKSDGAPNKDNVSQGFLHKLEMLKKAIDANPQDTTKMREYADLLSAAHKQKEAIEYYKKILSIDPKRTDILFSLSFIYYSLGEFDKAEELTQKILVIKPNNLNAQYNLGAIAATRGDKEKAREIWEKIVKQYPNEEVGIKAANSLNKL